MTIADGDIKGIPSGHGCKCSEDNCNYDICTAAGAAPDKDGGKNFLIVSNDFTADSEAGECKTINCQECVFPFKYNGEEYNQCITVDSENEVPWCAVQVYIYALLIPLPTVPLCGVQVMWCAVQVM